MRSRSLEYPKTPEQTLTTIAYVSIVPAVAGHSLKLIEAFVGNSGPTNLNVIFRDGTTGDTITLPLPARSPMALFPFGWRLTNGNDLQVALSAAGSVPISVFYAVEP